jgi:hypothetical protein
LTEIFAFAEMYDANNLKLSCVDFFLRTETITALQEAQASAQASAQGATEPIHVAYRDLIALVLTGNWKDLKVGVYNPP